LVDERTTAQTGSGRPVCAVTTQDNVTADRLVLQLTGMDVPVLRFDLADFPHRATMDAVFDGNGWTGALSTRRRTVALWEIGAVLWWHPGKPEGAPGGIDAVLAGVGDHARVPGIAEDLVDHRGGPLLDRRRG
jgi:hypothetical protein